MVQYHRWFSICNSVTVQNTKLVVGLYVWYWQASRRTWAPFPTPSHPKPLFCNSRIWCPCTRTETEGMESDAATAQRWMFCPKMTKYCPSDNTSQYAQPSPKRMPIFPQTSIQQVPPVHLYSVSMGWHISHLTSKQFNFLMASWGKKSPPPLPFDPYLNT